VPRRRTPRHSSKSDFEVLIFFFIIIVVIIIFSVFYLEISWGDFPLPKLSIPPQQPLLFPALKTISFNHEFSLIY